VIFDLGGRDKDYISPKLISNCDIISPNETEAMRLFETQLDQNVEHEKFDSIE
jgi:sugar/nucleoside kinase (ribokinase family)